MIVREIGAGGGNRTRDIQLGKVSGASRLALSIEMVSDPRRHGLGTFSGLHAAVVRRTPCSFIGNARCHRFGHVVHHGVGIAHRGLDIGMAEHLFHGAEVLGCPQCAGGARVTQIVDTEVMDASLLPRSCKNRPPPLVADGISPSALVAIAALGAGSRPFSYFPAQN